MDMERLKSLAGTTQLNEVSDEAVKRVIVARQAANNQAQDRHNTSNQTADSVERTGREAAVAKKKLGATFDAAGKRLARRRRSQETLEAMRMAGIPINEAYDDDDEDPDVKIANADKRQREFEKKNSKALKTADKVVEKGDAKDEKSASKVDDEPAETAPAEKKEEAAVAEKKAAAAKGRKCGERGGVCRAWLTDHPNATLAQFKAHAKELGMGVHNASTTYYTFKNKNKVAEAYMVFHPLDSTTVLAENSRMRRYEWIDLNEHTDYTVPLVFSSVFEAQTIVAGVGLMGQSGIVTKVAENDEPVDW